MSDIAPDRFIDSVFAYQRTAAVKAAIEIDLLLTDAADHTGRLREV